MQIVVIPTATTGHALALQFAVGLLFGSDAERARNTAIKPTIAAATARDASERTTPNFGISKKPASNVPSTPPTVLRATTTPTSRPTKPALTVSRSATGKAAPRRTEA